MTAGANPSRGRSWSLVRRAFRVPKRTGSWPGVASGPQRCSSRGSSSLVAPRGRVGGGVLAGKVGVWGVPRWPSVPRWPGVRRSELFGKSKQTRQLGWKCAKVAKAATFSQQPVSCVKTFKENLPSAVSLPCYCFLRFTFGLSWHVRGRGWPGGQGTGAGRQRNRGGAALCPGLGDRRRRALPRSARRRDSLVAQGDFRWTWAKPQAAPYPGSAAADTPLGGLGRGPTPVGAAEAVAMKKGIGGVWVR